MPSFKVPCPSCEAPVLIKNPNLVGTKVECPKCKYRFKVEEPAPEAGADKKDSKDKKDKKSDKKDKKKEKTKAPGGKKKLVPIIAGVVALLIVGGVGFAFFGGKGTKKPPVTARPNPNPNPAPVNPDDKDKDKEKDKKEDPPKPSVAASNKVTTNLLPGQAVAVYRFNMEPLSNSPAHGALVDEGVVQMFQGTFGFAPDDVSAYFHCFAGDTRDPFGVIKLKAPAKAPDLLTKMPVQPKPKPVKGRELFAFRSAPFLKAVANAFAMRALFGDLYATIPMAPTAAQKDKPYGVCVYDTQHVLIGDYALLERYLGELGDTGYPPFKSEMSNAPPPPAGAPPVPPKKGATPVVPPPAGDKTFTSIDAYRTIEFPLKRALDDLEADRTVTPLLVYAEKFDARQYDPKMMKKDYRVLATALDPVATRTKYLSGSVTTFTPRQLVANLRLTFNLGDDAREVAKEQLSPGLAIAVEVLKLYLTTAIEFRDYTVPGSMMPGVGMPPPVGGEGQPPPVIGPKDPKDPVKGDPKDPTLPASHVDLSMVDNQLLIAVDLNWTDAVFRTVISPRLIGVANQIKGKMAVFSAEAGPQALAGAGPKALAMGQPTPRGTWDRAKTDPNRLGLEYPPIQRVSLFVELLPHLGRGTLANSVNKNLAWYDEKNLPAGGAWVPELLVPSYPQSAWRATSPYAPDTVFGGTNYVALSGTGLDSPRFNPLTADTETKKKMGMTGYNWGSKADEVTDGLGNTIYLLQTPPGLQQPWIAGGGATVRGFDENDPMNGFKYDHGGRSGTYALMGDGSVRFVPAAIDKKVLLALGTRAGGDAALLADVDVQAPRLDPPKPAPKPAELKTTPEPPKPEEKKDPVPMPGAIEAAPAPREKK